MVGWEERIGSHDDGCATLSRDGARLVARLPRGCHVSGEGWSSPPRTVTLWMLSPPLASLSLTNNRRRAGAPPRCSCPFSLGLGLARLWPMLHVPLGLVVATRQLLCP